MSKNVSISEMGDAIMEELEKYSKLATDDLKAAVKETAASVRKDIQAGAPVDTGKYKKSWSVKNMHEDSQSIDLVVHSRNRYQLAHLLEHGHVKRGGGRVPAQPHIASAEERGNEKFVNTIKQKLGGGSILLVSVQLIWLKLQPMTQRLVPRTFSAPSLHIRTTSS